MKLSKVSIQNHFLLNSQDIDFIQDNNILDFIVLSGKSGVGKTILLNEIVSIFNGKSKHGFLEIQNASLNIDNIVKNYDLNFNRNANVSNLDIKIENSNFCYKDYQFHIKHNVLKDKLIYIPSDINNIVIQPINTAQIQFIKNNIDLSSFINLNTSITMNIQSVIAHYFQNFLKQNGDFGIKVSEELAFKELNSVFSDLNLNIKLSDINFNSAKLIFKNKKSQDISIDFLSSGQRQLIFRVLILKALNINNSVIIIDEPELSLSPSWQRKIIDIYSGLGKNNQFIIATQSPWIIQSVYPYQIKLISQAGDGSIQIENGEQLLKTSDGQEKLLGSFSDFSNSDYKMEYRLNELEKLAKDNKKDTKEFKVLLSDLEDEIAKFNGKIEFLKKYL